MNLNELVKSIHGNSTSKGFWDNEKGHDMTTQVLIKLLMVHAEVSEAVEAIHRGHPDEELHTEVIDCIIRLLDLCGAMNIDVDTVLKEKMKKNRGRERLHGKKAL